MIRQPPFLFLYYAPHDEGSRDGASAHCSGRCLRLRHPWASLLIEGLKSLMFIYTCSSVPRSAPRDATPYSGWESVPLQD